MTSIPSTMRAWVFTQRGSPEKVLRLSTSHPTPPAPTGNNVLIRVSHTSFTPAMGIMMNMIPSLFSRPFIPELECSGVIAAVGPSVPPHLSIGKPVLTLLPPISGVFFGAGALAEYTVSPADIIAVKPEEISFAEASGLTGNGITAVKMMRTAGVKSGDFVFVNGGSTGVGSLLIQMLKARGVRVVATGSGDKVEMVKSFGADEVVDYRVHSPLHAYLSEKYSKTPFDFIFDTVGVQSLYANCASYLSPSGLLINIGGMEGLGWTAWNSLWNMFQPVWLGGTPRRYTMFSTPPNADDLATVIQMVKNGALRVVVDQVFEMEDAKDAYRLLLSQRAKGKVVVKVQDV